MRTRFIVGLLSPLFICFSLGAVPAVKGGIRIVQPDGTTFQALITGDEFSHNITTMDGCAIVRGKDGVWYYALTDSEGCRRSSGFSVGDAHVPFQVMANSRNVPSSVTKSSGMSRKSRSNAITTYGALPVNKIPVIFAQFSDTKFSYSVDALSRRFSTADPKGIPSYFNDQFLGAATFEFAVCPSVVTVSHTSAYYAAADMAKAPEFIAEACTIASQSGLVDFSDYDMDGDGTVDRVYVFYAGKDKSFTGDDSMLWAHQYFLHDNINLTLNGKTIDIYACSSEIGKNGGEIAPIGTFCHELTHTFGIGDLYDTDEDGSGGTGKGIWGSGSLMDAGCYNDNGNTPPSFGAIERYILGINPGRPLQKGPVILRPVAEGGDYMILNYPGNDGECYLIECRTLSGWDSHIGAAGIAIYHIDRSDTPAGWSDRHNRTLTAAERWKYNEINCRPDRQCAALIEACPSASSIVQTFFPYNTTTWFTPEGKPAFRWWDGTAGPFSLTAMTFSGTEATFVTGDHEASIPVPVVDAVNVYQDLCILQWNASSGQSPAFVRWGKSGSALNEYTVTPWSPGKYAFRIQGLSPGTAYRVDILFKDESGSEGKIIKADFTTKSRSSGTYPYIWLGSATRDPDGTITSGSIIPLCLFNAGDNADITWTFGGDDITPSPDGFYHITSSGSLKAVITYPDNTTDVIIKNIRVK